MILGKEGSNIYRRTDKRPDDTWLDMKGKKRPDVDPESEVTMPFHVAQDNGDGTGTWVFNQDKQDELEAAWAAL